MKILEAALIIIIIVLVFVRLLAVASNQVLNVLVLTKVTLENYQ